MKTRFFRTSAFIPAILANGAAISVNTSTLPKKDWKTHSGLAPVAKENVHTMRSQKIAGTKSVVLEADSGKQLSVTQGEAEVFAVDYLTDLGYTVTPPRAQV